MKVGVLGAMQEEVAAVISMLQQAATTHSGGREYAQGTYAEHGIIVAHSRIGKVAAASAAIELIVRFGVEQILFTGLAGALVPDLTVGDVVVAEGLYQHDMDASPLFPPLEVPLTNCSRFLATPVICDRLAVAARAVLDKQDTSVALTETQWAHEDRPPCVVRGDIATGDQFIADSIARDRVLLCVPSAVCVEMEGAAVAQVCQEYHMPCGVIRMISDRADASAGSDFSASLGRLAASFSAAVVGRYLVAL